MAEPRTTHRSLIQRWVIEGTLALETPAHFGNGDAADLTDMPLLFDEASGAPLLPGTSIAGALRNYLRELECGDGAEFPNSEDDKGKAKEQSLLATHLFGGYRGDDNGYQSPLIVFDALGTSARFEIRDGVTITPETRTAEDKKKFDIQLLAAGTKFNLRFELLLGEKQEAAKICSALATALDGLTKGRITLGARKRRGYGQCSVGGWKVWKYDLKNNNDLLAWLSSEQDWQTSYAVRPGENKPIADLLETKLDEQDNRERAHLTAEFAIDGTLMIRSGFGESDGGPDTVHLHSPRKGKEKRVPVIPGTSWAGVLRHRALKIARTISKDKDKSVAFVDGIFGQSKINPDDKHVKASRISVVESEIQKSEALVVTRVKIDRFTGGAYETALFSEQPAVGKNETRVKLDLTLRNADDHEIGMLLLLLKDLWTGDLPIGGESGVGRGRLKGKNARLTLNAQEWEFEAQGEDGVALEQIKGEIKNAQEFVDAFNQRMVKHG